MAKDQVAGPCRRDPRVERDPGLTSFGGEAKVRSPRSPGDGSSRTNTSAIRSPRMGRASESKDLRRVGVAGSAIEHAVDGDAKQGGWSMRRANPEQTRWIGALVAGAALIFTGAGTSKKKEPPPPKIEETIGDVATIVGTDYKVEGVGLVMGLDNTGSDPAPSWQRSKLLDEMKKAGVQHPEQILRSKTVTLVTVRATVPAGVAAADKFDIDIEMSPATATTSLAGGWLVTTPLAQRAKTREGEKDDKVIASAVGPVMIGSTAKPNEPKVGRVLGGGRVKEESLYTLAIKETRRSGKTSQLLMNVVNNRFHQTEGPDQKGMATAKTDSLLVLRVPKTYHHNQTRYHQIVKLLHLIDNPTLREQRTEQWGKDLLDPKRRGWPRFNSKDWGRESRQRFERV